MAIADMQLRVTADVGDALSGLDSLKAKLGQTKEQQQQLKTTISDLNAALSQNAQNLAQTSDRLIALKSSGTASSTSIALLNTEVNELRAEQVTLNTALGATKTELDAVTSSLRTQASAVTTAQRSQDALGKAVGRFTDLNLVAAREVNNLGRRLLNIGSIAAFSAISAGVSLAIEGFGYLYDKLVGVDAATEAAKKAQDEFNQSLDEASKKGISTGAQLQAFVNIAKDATLPLQQRNEALREANKLLGEHGEKLTLTNVATAAATIEVQKYTEALINEALASKYADRIADLRIQQAAATKEYTKALKENKDAQDALNSNKTSVNESDESGSIAFLKQAENARTSLTNAVKNYRIISDQLIDTTNDLYSTELKATGAFGELGEKAKDSAKKVETIADVLKKMETEINVLNTKELFLHTDEAKGKIDAIQQAIDELIKKFGLNASSPLIISLYARLDYIKTQDDIKKTLALLAQPIKDQKIEPITLNIPIKPNFKLDESVISKQAKEAAGNYLKEMQDLTQKLNDNINKELAKVQNNIYESIGTGLGNALSGKGNALGDIFGGIFKQLGAGIKQLGQYAIEYATLKKVLSKALTFGSFGEAIGIGIALEAVGTVIENAASKIPGFAGGVTNFGGGIALVGEHGPELVQLPSGSNVIPNHQLGSFGNGQTINIIGETVLRGTDIYTVWRRGQQYINRNNSH